MSKSKAYFIGAYWATRGRGCLFSNIFSFGERYKLSTKIYDKKEIPSLL